MLSHSFQSLETHKFRLGTFLVVVVGLSLFACQSEQIIEVTVEREVVRTVEVIREVEREIEIVVTATATPSDVGDPTVKRSDISRPSDQLMNFMREYRRFELTAKYFEIEPDVIYLIALADVMIDVLDDDENGYRSKTEEYEPSFAAHMTECLGSDATYAKYVECFSEGILMTAKAVGAPIPDFNPSRDDWEYFGYWEAGLLGCLLEVRLVNDPTLDECHEKAHVFATRDLGKWWAEGRDEIADILGH